MLKIKFMFVLLSSVRLSKCDMEPFVVGGEKASIENFPHSAFLNVLCKTYDSHSLVPFICGASILNSNIVLTAAHCLFGCKYGSNMSIVVGHSNNELGIISSVATYVTHEFYVDGMLRNDIGLAILTTPLPLGKNVQRVALMKDPPYGEMAEIAGWGAYKEYPHQYKNHLMYAEQWVWSRTACKGIIKSLPRGVICAASGDDESYASWGDSGSALVVRGYIQIGIVSYKVPKISRSLVVYTDTGYFYEWIKKNSKRLYCV